MTPFCCLLGLRVHVQYRLNGNRRAERRRRRSQPAADGYGPVEVELLSVAVDTTVVGRRSRQQFVSFVSFRATSTTSTALYVSSMRPTNAFSILCDRPLDRSSVEANLCTTVLSIFLVPIGTDNFSCVGSKKIQKNVKILYLIMFPVVGGSILFQWILTYTSSQGNITSKMVRRVDSQRLDY